VATKKVYAVLLMTVVMAGIPWQGVEAKKEKPHPTTGTEGLLYAAGACDVPLLKSIIASGVDINATNANGYDALSLASFNRQLTLWEGWGFNKPRSKSAMTLTCPSAVTALTTAGADPWKTSFYQNPLFDEHRPGMIAVITVADDRADKGKSEKIMDEMTHGIELQLSGKSDKPSLHLGYPIVRLNEVRQKLLAAGFSAEESVAPDRVKACKALGLESVFEASLEDYRHKNVGIASSAGMRMKFELTDCKTGEPLWRSDQEYKLATGVLIGAFGGAKVQQTITGSVSGSPAVAFPAYEK